MAVKYGKYSSAQVSGGKDKGDPNGSAYASPPESYGSANVYQSRAKSFMGKGKKKGGRGY